MDRLKRGVALVLLCSAVAGCSAGTAQKATSSGSGGAQGAVPETTQPTEFIEPLKFGWVAPSKALLREHANVRGLKTEHVALLMVKPRDDGNLLVTQESKHIEKLNGEELPEGMGGIFDTQRPPDPKYVISPDGSLVDILGLDKMLEHSARALTADLPEERRAELQEMLQSPEMRNIAYKRSAEIWMCWAGNWIGLNVRPGETRQIESVASFVDGKPLTIPMIVSNFGESDEFPDHQLVELSYSFGGEEAKHLFNDLQVQAFFRTYMPDQMPQMDKVSFSKEVVYRVATSSESLLPVWAHLSEVETITYEDQSQVNILDREYWFSWYD